jgi:hypothetical protein
MKIEEPGEKQEGKGERGRWERIHGGEKRAQNKGDFGG